MSWNLYDLEIALQLTKAIKEYSESETFGLEKSYSNSKTESVENIEGLGSPDNS